MSDAAHSRGRMLFGAPVLLQDWDEETEEGAFQYWELFLDLLLVAAASAVTDQFKENLDPNGFLEFIVFYMILLNGWLLYTHHITSRFNDNSMAHSMVLFLYCVGFGSSIVNTGFDTVQGFCWGAILQRVAVLVMLASFAICLPRVRYWSLTTGILTTITMVLLLIVALLGDGIEESPLIKGVFWLAAVMEFLGEAFMVNILQGNHLVPINIEQTKERLGALELVMLGETVLSVTIIYRELQNEAHEEARRLQSFDNNNNHANEYYWVLGYSFLLVFMFLLFYFHMQPSPADHALRRSRLHGTALLILHKILGLMFLMVGTSVKLVVECLLGNEIMPRFASELMGYGVGGAIFVLLLMRYLHYGGKDGINFGHSQMYYGVDRYMDNITVIWWWTVGIAAVLPIVGVASGWTIQQDPVVLVGVHAALVFVMCLAESLFTHTLQSALEQQQLNGGGGSSGEGTALAAASASNNGGTYT